MTEREIRARTRAIERYLADIRASQETLQAELAALRARCGHRRKDVVEHGGGLTSTVCRVCGEVLP